MSHERWGWHAGEDLGAEVGGRLKKMTSKPVKEVAGDVGHRHQDSHGHAILFQRAELVEVRKLRLIVLVIRLGGVVFPHIARPSLGLLHTLDLCGVGHCVDAHGLKGARRDLARVLQRSNVVESVKEGYGQ